MSPTRIEEENNNNEEPNLPLSLDSGASEHLILDSEASAMWTGPYDRRNQSSEIWIAKYKNEFERLLLTRSLQRQEHPSTQREHLADQFTTYPRATSHVRPDRSTSHRTRITTADNSTHTVDISNRYLHLPVRAEQQRWATHSSYFCHTHGQQGSHNAHQCRNESVCRWPR